MSERLLILASSSIYRQELLSRLGVPFTCFAPDIDETPLPQETWQNLVMRLAHEKAQVAAQKYPEAICIGSDEVAALGNSLLGKPGNHDAAVTQLKQMSGQKVSFYTGVCLYSRALGHSETNIAITSVVFRELTSNMIENYLSKEKPYNSAGSFKSETLGSALITRFEGEDPTAMIGLPLIMLCDMLRKVGIEVI